MRPVGSVKTKPQEHEVKCFCGAAMTLRFSPKFKGGQWFYGCTRFPNCKGTHGCHQDNGKPLGVPADQETKAWRIKAHDAFDRIWRGKLMTRREAYAWLAQKMNVEEIHIGESNLPTCVEIERLCLEWLQNKK